MQNNTLNTKPRDANKWWNNVKTVAGLSKSDPLTSIAHEGQFKNGLELAEIIASSFCQVCNDLPHLQFDKAPVDGVPDELIITSHQFIITSSSWKRSAYKTPPVQMIFLTEF